MPINLATIERAVADIARKENLVAAYLHGSAATGRMDDESDIDIAFLADAPLTRDERYALRMRCLLALMEASPDEALSDKFDVVLLRDVPVLLQYNVIRKGRRLYERNRGERMDFELSVERAYDDEEPYLRQETEIILERILSRPVA